MIFSPQDVEREVAATGFPGETLEKVFRLMSLINALNSHSYLKPRVALKGGTALNLFHFNVPRLSVDIDINYIGPADRDTMLADRPKVERALKAVCMREGLAIKRTPFEHAGGKWRLTYTDLTGNPGNLELDVNFMFRIPLWPLVTAECHPVGSFRAAQMPMLDPHELAVGKLTALLARSAGRDIFDVRGLLSSASLDRAKLRLGFVVYGGINRKDWRTVSLNDVKGAPNEIRRDLVPLMRADQAPSPEDLASWTEKLVAECRDLLSAVLPLEPNEQEFLRRLNEEGRIAPNLLTDGENMQAIIREHPGLRWKALNVRKHFGFPAENEPTG